MAYYDLAVRVAAENKISGALAVIGKDLLQLERGFGSLQKTMKSVLGGLAVYGGTELLKVTGAIVKHGYEFVQLQNKMAYGIGANISAAERNRQVAEATAAAWKLTSQYTNVSATQAMNLAIDLKQVFGTQEEAIKFLPEAVQFA